MAKLEALYDRPDLESEGVWFRWKADIELKLRSVRAPQVRERLAKIGARLRSGGSGLSAREEENLKRLYARHVVVSWKNIQDASGADVPYSPETAYNMLANPKLASLWEWVVNQATNPINFGGDFEEEEPDENDAGN